MYHYLYHKNRIKLTDNAFITAFVDVECKANTITSISICTVISRQYIIACNIMALLTPKMFFLQ